MRIVLAPSATAAYHYMHRRQPEPTKYLYVERVEDLQGICPQEVHVVPGATAHPRFDEILGHVLRCEAKMPLTALWWYAGKLTPRDAVLDRVRVAP